MPPEPLIDRQTPDRQVPAHAAEARATVDNTSAQATVHVSIIAPGREPRAGRLDAAAGCEFVDDRIHLRE